MKISSLTAEEFNNFQYTEDYEYFMSNVKNIEKYVEEYFLLESRIKTDFKHSVTCLSFQLNNRKDLNDKSLRKLTSRISSIIGIKKSKQRYLIYINRETLEVKLMYLNRYVYINKENETYVSNIIRNLAIYNKPKSIIFNQLVHVLKTLIKNWNFKSVKKQLKQNVGIEYKLKILNANKEIKEVTHWYEKMKINGNIENKYSDYTLKSYFELLSNLKIYKNIYRI